MYLHKTGCNAAGVLNLVRKIHRAKNTEHFYKQQFRKVQFVFIIIARKFSCIFYRQTTPNAKELAKYTLSWLYCWGWISLLTYLARSVFVYCQGAISFFLISLSVSKVPANPPSSELCLLRSAFVVFLSNWVYCFCMQIMRGSRFYRTGPWFGWL